MNGRFEDLWSTAADDGAACLSGIVTGRGGGVEVDELLDAWYRERTDRIECSLVLEQARRLLAGLLADGSVTPRRRRQAGRLIRAIHGIQQGGRP